jgi:hypothetical protein
VNVCCANLTVVVQSALPRNSTDNDMGDRHQVAGDSPLLTGVRHLSAGDRPLPAGSGTARWGQSPCRGQGPLAGVSAVRRLTPFDGGSIPVSAAASRRFTLPSPGYAPVTIGIGITGIKP